MHFEVNESAIIKTLGEISREFAIPDSFLLKYPAYRENRGHASQAFCDLRDKIKSGYYTYQYTDVTGKKLYVGMGSKGRAFQHFYDTESTIFDLLESDDVIPSIMTFGNTRHEALYFERTNIAKFKQYLQNKISGQRNIVTGLSETQQKLWFNIENFQLWSKTIKPGGGKPRDIIAFIQFLITGYNSNRINGINKSCYDIAEKSGSYEKTGCAARKSLQNQGFIKKIKHGHGVFSDSFNITADLESPMCYPNATSSINLAIIEQILQHDAFHSKGLGKMSAVLFLYTYLNPEKVFRPIDYYTDLGLNRHTVTRHLARLADAGLIIPVNVNGYRLNPDFHLHDLNVVAQECHTTGKVRKIHRHIEHRRSSYIAYILRDGSVSGDEDGYSLLFNRIATRFYFIREQIRQLIEKLPCRQAQWIPQVPIIPIPFQIYENGYAGYNPLLC